MDLLQHDAQKVRQRYRKIKAEMKKIRFSLNLDLSLSRSAILRECYSVVSPANPPLFAGASLRILSSIDHNVTSGSPYRTLAIGRTSPDDTSSAD
jgi:hypothetical protein